ncbi:putative quinol monooxygenase [Slackia heliotrinireducens]|uniref:putative quinol monooxygenase n=1 Tax=Slackia heliotrinireducens TaxID=84110 RepID=UPI0033160376
MIKIVAKQTIREECVEDFLALCKELVAASVNDPGNVYYTLNANTKVPNEYAFIECWEDQAAIQNHMAQPHFQKAAAAMQEMLVGEPVMDIFTEAC